MYLAADDDPVLTPGGKRKPLHEVMAPVVFARGFDPKAVAN